MMMMKIEWYYGDDVDIDDRNNDVLIMLMMTIIV
jgi:hypothetical protein